MKIFYDKDADAAYIQLEATAPDGVIEIDEGVHLDTNADNRIIGIEILNASHKISLASLFVYEVDATLASAA
jgi:uncharacterized protein YuzE